MGAEYARVGGMSLMPVGGLGYTGNAIGERGDSSSL
jgi:hypothetical protein